MSNKGKESKKTQMQILMEAAGLSASKESHKEKKNTTSTKAKSKKKKKVLIVKRAIKNSQPRPRKEYSPKEKDIYNLRKRIERDYSIEFKKPEQLSLKILQDFQKNLEKKKKGKSDIGDTGVSANPYHVKPRSNPVKEESKVRASQHSSTRQAIQLGEYERYSYVELSEESRLNPQLLDRTSSRSALLDLSSLSRTQVYDNCDDGVELVIGLDFGTANTKVVIQESGSGKAWAIPFTDAIENPYLLLSHVYLDGDSYSLNGKSEERIDNLKLPLILNQFSNDNLVNMTVFLALVIRHSREWFLENAAQAFHDNHFDWFYKMGLPAENNDNSSLVETYNRILLASLKASLIPKSTLTRSDILGVLNSSPEQDELSDYCEVHPEIQAQLGGYVQSDRWDSRRIKVMMIDIGGGTVDASIINVTKQDGEEKYNCLKTKVESLGIRLLHKHRLDWLSHSADKTELPLEALRSEISSAYNNSGNVAIYPDSVNEYASHASWPEIFSVDGVFYNAFSDIILKDIIYDVRRRIDIKNHEQWKSLQLIFCGGGSLHPLYAEITKHPNFDVARLDKPSNINADIDNKEYHRISVAYGLSFMDQGWFVNASEIEPMREFDSEVRSSYRGNFIDKDSM